MKLIAFRYSYQQVGQGWFRYAFVSYNTKHGAKSLTARWNRRDRGRLVWTFEECFQTDIDHPSRTRRTPNA